MLVEISKFYDDLFFLLRIANTFLFYFYFRLVFLEVNEKRRGKANVKKYQLVINI